MGLPPPEPLRPGGPNLHYFLLGDDAFLLVPWQGKEGLECFWNISRKGQGTADNHGVKATSCEGHCVNMCGATYVAKHQQDLLKDYFNNLGALAGQEDRV